MKSIFKFSAIILIILFNFSCSEQTVVDSEILTNETFFIPADKEKEILVLEEINKYRISQGLSSFLKLDIIKSQTHQHTGHMIETNLISHTNFTVRSKFLKRQAGAKKVGENLAVGFVSPSSLVNGWLSSESHKRNIEGDYTHFDITAEQNEDGKWFYTNIFIKK